MKSKLIKVYCGEHVVWATVIPESQPVELPVLPDGKVITRVQTFTEDESGEWVEQEEAEQPEQKKGKK